MDEVMEECKNKGMPLDQSCRSVQEQKCEPSTAEAASTAPLATPSAPATPPSAHTAAASPKPTTESVVHRLSAVYVVLTFSAIMALTCVCVFMWRCTVHKREKKRPFFALPRDSVEMLDLRSDGGYLYILF